MSYMLSLGNISLNEGGHKIFTIFLDELCSLSQKVLDSYK